MNHSEWRSVFKSLNEKMMLIKKMHESHCSNKVRKNTTWMESYAAWIDYGKEHPDHKNRTPLDESRLSSWVHEQRKAFKN